MVKDKVKEAEWKYLDVNEHWHQLQNIVMETAQDICGMSKGPCSYRLPDFPRRNTGDFCLLVCPSQSPPNVCVCIVLFILPTV